MGRTDGKIYLRKRTLSEWFVAFVFFLPFAQAFLSQLLRIPDVIKFLADLVLVLLLLKVLMISKDVQLTKQFRSFLIIVAVFFAYVTVAYFFNYQSIFYYAWGLRNYFRFYAAFIGYVFFLRWVDVKRWLKLFDWLYILNFFVVLVQFAMGYRQDYLGGIFGVEKSCNGGLLVFLTIVNTKSVLAFMRSKGSTLKCLLFSFIGLFIAALAELKFFFVIFIVIVIISAIMTKSSVRKTVFFTLSIVMILTLSSLLSLMYDEFAGFLSLDNLWTAIFNPNYATKEDIGRLTAIPTISENFLKEPMAQLFGMGLGNADTSSLEMFNTPFFEMYGTIHYSIFTYAMAYLELGIVGLIIYTSFYVAAFIVALNLYRKRVADEGICQLAMITSVMCIVFMFYNSVIRTEMAGYLVYFILALPLISVDSVKLRSKVGK